MAIKEALGRTNERERKILPPDLDNQPITYPVPGLPIHRPISPEAPKHKSYKEEVFDAGKRLLKQHNVPELLQEIYDLKLENGETPGNMMVEPERPDQDGMTYVNFVWTNKRMFPDYNSLTVRARPVTGALIVEGEEHELLSKEKLKEDKTVIEDAIVFAYKNPKLLKR